MVYNANTVRYLDNNNKSLIQFNDEYHKDGLLKKLTFSFIGVGSSSGNSKDNDFEKITVNDNPFLLKDGTLGAKEDLKNYILNYFNKNEKLKKVEYYADDNLCEAFDTLFKQAIRKLKNVENMALFVETIKDISPLIMEDFLKYINNK